MEKYGVCNTCYNITGEEGLIKTASGDMECPRCHRVVLQALNLEEDINVSDQDKKK